ncbi:ATP11 protein-domain-containing protein [Gautieria morchelliformis]|nr:ATP11 protein-domain-containing protein [Gautieria morchelliformis]
MSFQTPVRKDSSPVKPLADFMDVRKILDKEHTAEQISALWTAYHATRSQGTGRGYLSATIPFATYHKMISLAKKYPTFLLPLPRPSPDTQQVAHEFYFLQWAFHDAPPHPAQLPSLPFGDPVRSPPASAERNPSCTTVLFTPLQEYKLRQTFAQPYLVLTHYTDLAATHGIVLMRGEMTVSPSSAEKYLISQSDGQLLALGVQRFYLTSGADSSERRVELLRRFHEEPDAFQWEELLAVWSPTS